MAEYMGKSEHQKKRAYSPAVITQGGKTIWLAGQTATQDEQGKDISGNFEAQVRTIFSLLDKTLQKLRRQPRQHGDHDGVHQRCAATATGSSRCARDFSRAAIFRRAR